ncbi:glycosyltransferase family 2 protein [Pseudonocardia sp.]|uniref:glycosyltransferase family 2 protein n=1 Tax=Pseudonocardia sp. TaxID=60912 RepID=UPI003D0E219D
MSMTHEANGNGPVVTHVIAASGGENGSAVAPRGVVPLAASVIGPVAPGHVIPSVSLIIPTKNEASNVSWVLEQVPSVVTEIVIVDGHSSDATIVTARSSRNDVKVVTQEGMGKGDALRKGFAEATGEILVMIDADGSMNPQEITHFLHFLDNGYDFVKGSRFTGGGGSRDITRMRRMGNMAFRQMVNVLFDAQLTDLCYGYCAFHRRYLPFLNLRTSGFEVETALVISALRAGLRIAEVPSMEMPRRHGRSNLRTFRDGSRVLNTIIREHRSRNVVLPGRGLPALPAADPARADHLA